MFLTVSNCYWLPLTVYSTTMEFLYICHCLLWLLTVSHFISHCLPCLITVYHCLSGSMELLHVSHCLSLFLAVLHCLS